VERIQEICVRHGGDNPLLTCISQVLDAILEFEEPCDAHQVLTLVTSITQYPRLANALLSSTENAVATWFSEVCRPKVFQRLHREYLVPSSSIHPPVLRSTGTSLTLEELEEWNIRSQRDLHAVLTQLSLLIVEAEMNDESSKDKENERISLLASWMEALESSKSVILSSQQAPSWACCPILYAPMNGSNDP